MAYSGGWTPGMAPHIIDLPVWALDLGFPLNTSASGGRFVLKDDGDAYDHHEVLWQYPNLTMTWMSSLTNSYGFDFHGEPEPAAPAGHLFPRRQRHHVCQLRHVQNRARRRQDEGLRRAAQVHPAFARTRTRMAGLRQVAPAAELQSQLPRQDRRARSS